MSEREHKKGSGGSAGGVAGTSPQAPTDHRAAAIQARRQRTLEFNRLTKGACGDGATVDAAKLKEWQKAHGIEPADGIVGPQTLAIARAEQKHEGADDASSAPATGKPANDAGKPDHKKPAAAATVAGAAPDSGGDRETAGPDPGKVDSHETVASGNAHPLGGNAEASEHPPDAEAKHAGTKDDHATAAQAPPDVANAQPQERDLKQPVAAQKSHETAEKTNGAQGDTNPGAGAAHRGDHKPDHHATGHHGSNDKVAPAGDAHATHEKPLTGSAAHGPGANQGRYLREVYDFFRQQTLAEKDAHTELKAHRDEHPVVGAISETAATITGNIGEVNDAKEAGAHGKSFQPKKLGKGTNMPDVAMWDLVFAKLNEASACLDGDVPDLDGAKKHLLAAVDQFKAAHKTFYEYRTATEGGGQTAATTLKGVEIGCEIIFTVLSMGAGNASLAGLGVRGVFKLAAEGAAKGLGRAAIRSAVAGGVNKLAQSAAEETVGYDIGLEDHIDWSKVLREGATAAASNFLGVIIGGALSKVFMRTLGEVLGSRMAPDKLLALAEMLGSEGPIPPEMFVKGGWKWLTGFAADAATTTLMTALLTTLEVIRTGGKQPSKEQFVSMVIEQLIQNGFIQLLLGAVTHGNGKATAKSGKHGGDQHGQPDHAHPKQREVEHGGRQNQQPAHEEKATPEPRPSKNEEPAAQESKAGDKSPEAVEPTHERAGSEAELEPTGVQRATADKVKQLRTTRKSERDPQRKKALDAEIDQSLADGRRDMEAMVRKLHPTLQPVDAANNLYKVTLEGKEYQGTLEVLLDFKPPSQATSQAGDQLFSKSSKTEDATVEATGGLAGTSSQGRVNKYPGDIDLAESIRIEAKNAAKAAEALAQTVQKTVTTATQPASAGKTPIVFEGMSAGRYPPGHPKAGDVIYWQKADVEAGQMIWLGADGASHVLTLAEALGAPGNRVVNTYWKGPIDSQGTFGEITKVIRYDAFDASTGEKLFGTPLIGQAHQEVAFGKPQIHDTNRASLTDALAPQVDKYAKEGNWLKAVKRAHTVARMNGDMAALNDFAPLMTGSNAETKQLIDHLNVFMESIVTPDGSGNQIPQDVAKAQADRLASRVSAVDKAAGTTMQEAIGKAADVRANDGLKNDMEKVMGALTKHAKEDADFAKEAERVLRGHGYLKSDEGGGVQ